jgi:pimeloyl-ACP methyl ester carboxylesterase
VSSTPVVLLHGLATTATRTWRETGWIDLLTEAGREVIAPDLPGHGTAAKSHDPEDYGDLPSWVLQQLPQQPVDAVGFSMGARLLLTVAAENPDRFNRLVVSGVGASLFHHDPEHTEMIRAGIAGNATAEDPVAGHFSALADAGDIDRESLLALLSGSGDALTPEQLSTATMPVLVVLGDQDFAGPAEPLLNALPDAQLLQLRGVDHFGTPKQFEFIDSALEFLGAQPF